MSPSPAPSRDSPSCVSFWPSVWSTASGSRAAFAPALPAAGARAMRSVFSTSDATAKPSSSPDAVRTIHAWPPKVCCRRSPRAGTRPYGFAWPRASTQRISTSSSSVFTKVMPLEAPWPTLRARAGESRSSSAAAASDPASASARWRPVSRSNTFGRSTDSNDTTTIPFSTATPCTGRRAADTAPPSGGGRRRAASS